MATSAYPTYPHVPRADTLDALMRRLLNLESALYQLQRNRTYPTQTISGGGPFKLGDVATTLPRHGDMLRWNANTGLWEPVTACLVWGCANPPAVAASPRVVPRDDMLVTGFSMNALGGSSTVLLQRNGATVAGTTLTGTGHVVVSLVTPVRYLGGTDDYSVSVTATASTTLGGEILLGSAQSLP